MVEQLGERLLAAGLVTLREVTAAAPAGGGTGTRFLKALLAAGLSEDALAGFFVSQGAGPLVRSEAMLAAPSEVAKLLPGEMARSLSALPFAIEDGRLVVAMLNPWDSHALHELARVTQRPISPRVARLAELGRALEQRYPLTNVAQRAHEPVLELVQRRKPRESVNRAPAGADAVLPLVRRKAIATPATPAERTFERPRESPNVRSFSGARTAEYSLEANDEKAVQAPGSAQATKPPDPIEPAPPPVPLEEPAAPSKPATAPVVAPKRVPGATGPKLSSPRLAKRSPAKSAPPPALTEQPHPLDSWGPLSESRPPPPARSAALPELGQVLAAFRDAESRDEVIRVATEATAAVAHGAVLLAVRRDVLKGWDGRGQGVSSEAVRNLWIPVRSPGLLRDVLESGRHHVGPHGDTAADQLFRAAIAGGNGTLVIEDVKVAGRTVALLCADGVTDDPRAIERVEVVARATAEALERLLREAKRKR